MMRTEERLTGDLNDMQGEINDMFKSFEGKSMARRETRLKLYQEECKDNQQFREFLIEELLTWQIDKQ